MIKVSVLIATLNEAASLPRCLAALQNFDEIIVIDSGSADETITIAENFGVRVENFNWNGEYPKKRQWCLDHLNIKYDFVFFVDGDEEVTPELAFEIKNLEWQAAGYFVKGKYIWQGRSLNHGLQNNKLALINRHKIGFPVVDDLEIDGMGEIEGHYQPVLKAAYKDEPIAKLNEPLLHFAYEETAEWHQRHKRYAKWEAQMIMRQAYPKDPDPWRQRLKTMFRKLPCRGFIAFCHSYIFKLGFLDGGAGYQFACSRWAYYRRVSGALTANKSSGNVDAIGKARSAP